MTLFQAAFKIVVSEEGGFTANPADPGNWTGGARGRGVCRGTKYGIAAGAYPTLDIAAVTLEQARTLYYENYWTAVHADELPSSLVLLVFDAAVNCGVSKAVHWLQTALGCQPDGMMGPETIAAVQNISGDCSTIRAHFQALRLDWMSSLPTWQVFGLGWTRRVCSLPYSSLTLESNDGSTPL